MEPEVIYIVGAAVGGGSLTGGASLALIRIIMNGIRDDVRGMREHMQKMDRRLSRMEGRHEPYDGRGSE